MTRGLREELAEIARRDFSGVPLAEALRRLIREHRIDKIMARYQQLQADPEEWARYRAEAELTDKAAGDGIQLGVDEYPEYNRERSPACALAGMARGLR